MAIPAHSAATHRRSQQRPRERTDPHPRVTRKRARWFLLAFALSLAANPVTGGERPPMPDLTQTDPRGGFTDGGRSFCGPVAASNSIACLFPAEMRKAGLTQYDVVNRLASPAYMNTHRESGTGPDGLVRGVRRLLEDFGHPRRTLRFQGWRPHRKEYSAGAGPVSLPWIDAALANGGAAWLNVGWYRIKADHAEFERVGGHWVTAVAFAPGHGPDSTRPVLIVHDPAPRAGSKPSREHVVMTRLAGGRLTGNSKNLPHPANGFFRMEGGMHIKKSADCAILDGAVVLR